jgi:hypothetical protein
MIQNFAKKIGGAGFCGGKLVALDRIRVESSSAFSDE